MTKLTMAYDSDAARYLIRVKDGPIIGCVDEEMVADVLKEQRLSPPRLIPQDWS